MTDLADSSAFDGRLSSVEVEAAFVQERCEALLDAFRNFKASVVSPVQRNAFSSALVKGIVALAGGDTRRAGGAVIDETPEEVLADALDALSREDQDAPDWHHGLAEPLGAALGAPLLAPLADGLRQVGSRRHVLASRLEVELMKPLEAFLRDTLHALDAARVAYLRRCRDAEVAQDALARLGTADAHARASAAELFEDAALARDSARAALSLAVIQVEGARRHVVLSCVSQAVTALHAHATAVAADLAALHTVREASAEFARQAAAQAEQRVAAQAEAVQAFMQRRQAECDAAKVAARVEASAVSTGAGITASTPDEPVSFSPNGVRAVHEGWLLLRTPSGFARRYVVAHANGELCYHRTREGALSPASARTAVDDNGSAAAAPKPAEVSTAADATAPPPPAASGGLLWGMGTQLLRGAVSGARTLAESAGELATRVTASGGSVQLLTASVKLGPPENDPSLRNAPFVFRVVSAHVGASVTLQAESAAERAAWVAALQGIIASLLGGPQGAGSPGMQALREAPGNTQCADCGAPDPDWASLNLCVVLCHRCAGAHRRLGAAVSAVRSLNLDEDAWTPSVCAVFAAHGNAAANAVWAPRLAPTEALAPDAAMEARLESVRAKYVDRLFVDTALVDELREQPGALVEAAAQGNVARVLALLAAGAPVNAAAGEGVTRTPLAAAAAAGSPLAVQALLLNGAHACGTAAGGDAVTTELLELVPADAPGAASIRDMLSAAAVRQMRGRALVESKESALVPEPAAQADDKPAAGEAKPAAADEAPPSDSFQTVPVTPLKPQRSIGDEDEWLQDAPEATPGGTAVTAATVDDEWTG